MPTPTYTLIQEQIIGSSQASITFSSIPQTYKDLVVEVVGTSSVSSTNAALYFNGSDLNTSYNTTLLKGSGSAASSSRYGGTYSGMLFDIVGVSATGDYRQYIAHIQSYASTSFYKTVLMRGNNPATEVLCSVGTYLSTSAITSVSIKANFATNSIFRLWGVIG